MELSTGHMLKKRDHLKEYIFIIACILISTCISQINGNNNNETTPEVQTTNTTSNWNYIFQCPKLCSCSYEPLQQDLKISCHAFNKTTTGSSQQYEVNISNGVNKLTITNLTIDFWHTYHIIHNASRNHVEELILEEVVIDPTYFFSSFIFMDFTKSLKKLSISKSRTVEYGQNEDPINKEGFKMIHFTNLEKLDSLTLCDNSPTLSKFILNSLPIVHHITIVKASISILDLNSFNHLEELKSLNLSNNHIHTIPNGLGKYLYRLETLDLSHNRIEHLQEEVFLGFTQLKHLDVSNNKIRYIDTEVFIPLQSLNYIDISFNEMLQIFDPYFEENKDLRTFLMSNTWSEASFADEETAFRSLTEINKLINTLQAVEILDLSNNHLTTIPESLSHLTNLQRVSLHGNSWKCTCDDRWVLPWLTTSSISIEDSNHGQNLLCSNPNKQIQPFSESYIRNLNCSSSNIKARMPIKFFALLGKSILLKCHPQRKESPTITWVTPKQRKLDTSENSDEQYDESRSYVLENGDLHITNVTTSDFGLYLCIASYKELNITHYVHLGMDTSIFLDIQYISIIVGWMGSIGFLLAILVVQLVRVILIKCGVDCPKPISPYNARRVKTFFESLEQHNNSQLDWLRDNYNMQAKRIKDNCLSQLERIRESYTTQTKNLSEIRDYGTQQLHTMRDQYFDQIRRVSSYSIQNLCRVRENYLFQRNRVCKFSSHQLLKLRESYKWQAQTLNKILENLPNLNFDTCRGMGACGRTESIYLDDIDCEFVPSETIERPQNSKEGMDAEKMEHVSLLLQPEFVDESTNKEEHLAVVIVDEEITEGEESLTT